MKYTTFYNSKTKASKLIPLKLYRHLYKYLQNFIDIYLRINDEEIHNRLTKYRGINDLKKYKLTTDYIDPLEEFVAPYNAFSDHTLYLLTHAPCFVNLKIIDLRGNQIKSLLWLRPNIFEECLIQLEELYVDTIVNEGESYDVSFLFKSFYGIFNTLQVLWIEAKENNLYVENYEVSNINIDELSLDENNAVPDPYRRRRKKTIYKFK